MKVLLQKSLGMAKQDDTCHSETSADMAQVIVAGADITTSELHALTPHYFDNFSPNNAGADPGYGWGY